MWREVVSVEREMKVRDSRLLVVEAARGRHKANCGSHGRHICFHFVLSVCDLPPRYNEVFPRCVIVH